MKLSNLKLKYFSQIVLTCALSVSVTLVMLHFKDSSSNEVFERSHGENHLSLYIENPETLAEVVQKSDLVVEGQIKNISKEEKRVYAEEGTPEAALLNKNNSNFVTLEYKNYNIEVSEQFKGDLNENGNTITLEQSLLGLGVEPNMEIGDDVILILNKNENNNSYYATHPEASYFKVQNNEVQAFFDFSNETNQMNKQEFEMEVENSNE